MPPDTLLADIAEQILDSVVDYFNAEGVSVPDHSYVWYGDPAVDFTPEDCASALIVAWRRNVMGSPDDEFGEALLKCEMPRAGEYEIWLLRCAIAIDDAGNAPSADDLNNEGIDHLTDSWMLSKAVYKKYKEGLLVPGGKDRPVALGEQRPYGSQGGARGVIQSLVVSYV